MPNKELRPWSFKRRFRNLGAASWGMRVPDDFATVVKCDLKHLYTVRSSLGERFR